jgi:hypothetical protein
VARSLLVSVIILADCTDFMFGNFYVILSEKRVLQAIEKKRKKKVTPKRSNASGWLFI